MMCFPEAQKKAQEEIDRVIGSDRLPSIADREQLPYVRALCWEVLRWRPIAPLGQLKSPCHSQHTHDLVQVYLTA